MKHFKLRQLSHRLDRRVLPFLLTGFWLLLHGGSLLEGAASLGSRLSLILWLLAGLALVGLGIGRKLEQIDWDPGWRWGPILLLLASALMPVVGRSWPGSLADSLELSWGVYGLLGGFLSGSLWRRGLPFVLLLSGLIPFGTTLGTGLGFPARLLTAQVVEQLLRGTGLAAISSHDIILLENGIAHVDLPCSGLKGLWVGGCFLLGATWLERRPIGWRWLGVAVVTFAALVVANILRVWALVVVGYGLGQPWLAEMLHVPLGVLGFVAACGLSWAALQWLPSPALQPGSPPQSETGSPAFPPPPLFVVLLLPLLWLGSLGIAPVHSAPVALNLQIWQGSPEWVTESLELTPAELDFFRPEVGTAVLKQQFETPDLKGSLLLVGSSTWRQQHAPELCWAAHGLRVEQMTAVQWPGLQARWLSLEQGSLSGFYWFQSAQGSTDNLLSRVGAQLRGGDPQWVLVSALIEGSHGPDQPEVQALVEQIQTQVQSVFAAESSS